MTILKKIKKKKNEIIIFNRKMFDKKCNEKKNAMMIRHKRVK